ncbi:hypothetical protein F4V43_00290 [Paenibacillus spiritus]|uniref:Glyoxalase/fosfomycin resistance/dioxygenase domain-containing protein n=1 Tax=Paenibacillus spiritus TaxID=2496557 RepID=A0A5J5GK31_9BACL|nr:MULTISPECIES: VOC family protein [Paenibacillus]KAA9008609.1 hypothetical protein F4V43_00290 [Paenibacillus spiritus]
MLVPQLYLNGACTEAMELYRQAFGAKTESVMYDPQEEPGTVVIHAEMNILGSRIMLSDFGGTGRASAESTMEIVAICADEAELRQAYQVLEPGSETVTPIGPTFYSSCLVQLVDRFGVKWCLMV